MWSDRISDTYDSGAGPHWKPATRMAGFRLNSGGLPPFAPHCTAVK